MEEQEEVEKVVEEAIDTTKELEQKIKELEEKLLRNQADLQNYRRRKDEEMMQFVTYANEDLIKELLPVLDNFERAISMDDDNPNDEVSKFLKGIRMVYDDLGDTLKRYGLKEVEALDKPLDPNIHQAVMVEHADGKEDDIILEVFNKGYQLKEKLIRPAMVKVNKKESKEKENDKNE